VTAQGGGRFDWQGRPEDSNSLPPPSAAVLIGPSSWPLRSTSAAKRPTGAPIGGANCGWRTGCPGRNARQPTASQHRPLCCGSDRCASGNSQTNGKPGRLLPIEASIRAGRAPFRGQAILRPRVPSGPEALLDNAAVESPQEIAKSATK
jgi:hypothetical protein